MRAPALVSLSSARGADITSIGNALPETRRHPKRAAPRSEREEDARGAGGPRGKQTRVYRRPEWSHAELGIGAGGRRECADGRWRDKVPRLPWLACLMAYAGDAGGATELWTALVSEAVRLGKRGRWPPTVPGADGRPVFYREALASLALDEIRFSSKFSTEAADVVRAAYIGVTVDEWRRHLADRYAPLRARFDAWVDSARAMIQRWIDEPDAAQASAARD